MATANSPSLAMKRTAIRTTAGTMSRSVIEPTDPPARMNAIPPAAADSPKIAEFSHTEGRGPSRNPSTRRTPITATAAATSGPNNTAAATCAATENDALVSCRLTTSASAAMASPTSGATATTGPAGIQTPAIAASATLPQNIALRSTMYRRTARVIGPTHGRGAERPSESLISARRADPQRVDHPGNDGGPHDRNAARAGPV